MVDINPTISIITLNVIGLKAQRLSEWIKTQDPTVCCPEETGFKYKDTCRLKVNGWRIYHSNTDQRKAGVRLLSFQEEQTSKQGKFSRVK